MIGSVFPESFSQKDAPPGTIVAVDDVAVNLELYGRVLKRLPNVRVVSFTSSAGALEWSRKNDFDLLLIDFHMPPPNGLEFVQRLRKMPTKGDIPVVMITVAQEKEIRYHAIQLGVNDFLIKPIDPIEFLARVKNLLLLRARGKDLLDRASWLAKEVERATGDIVGREEETIDRLVRAAEYRDRTTGAHIQRVARFAERLARELGLSADDQRLIRLAAPMHDVGKVATPDGILLKPAALTPEERRTVQQHVVEGHDILRESSSKLLQLAAEIALSHHERWDGAGYPHGLSGDSIPLSGRIVAVCDVYDALVSVRPYKKAWSFVDSAHYIESGSGTQFDPMVVAAFKAVAHDFVTITHEYPDNNVA
jgi:putative two-component system response regulator